MVLYVAMKVNPTVFREYDIRGIAGEKYSAKEIATYEKWYGPFPGITLTPEVVLNIGKAYGTIIRRAGGSKVVVGYEVRPQAEKLREPFIEGILTAGCNVLDVDVALTPLIYFATAFWNLDGGVNITGSHNIYFYNGFKLMKKDVWPLFGAELQEMREMIEKEDFLVEKKGERTPFLAFPTYEEYIISHTTLQRSLKIVIDAGNGSAGIFAPELFRKLGCEVVELYCEPNATFPNHDPDPENPHNVEDLGKKVREEKADVGIAFDADGDRVGFVDEQGSYIPADLPLLVFAKDALLRNPGKKILFDTKCSQLLEELVPQYGGVPFMHRTGHAPIKRTLREDSEVILAGEQAAHFYFVENYFKIDDGLYAAAKMLEIFSSTKDSFSSLFADIPLRVRTPEIKLPCVDETKFEVVKRITKNLKEHYPSILLDGIRIQVTKTAWGIVRASNTSPYITVRVEGISEAEVLQVKNILADELEKHPEVQDQLNREKVAVLEGKLAWV